MIQSLELQEIWQKNSSETMWMIYHKKSEFSHREFLTIQDMQSKRFMVNYENRLCQNFIKNNSVDRRDLVSIHSGQMMKKIQ